VKGSGIHPRHAIDGLPISEFENIHCRVLRARAGEVSAKLQGGDMFRTKRSSLLIYAVLVTSVVCLAAAISSAQIKDQPVDTYRVNYYSDALTKGAPDGTVHIVNPGTAVTKLNADGKPLNGSLCAQVYVLNNDEQEVECCGCVLSPDSERTLSINKDLLGNPINTNIVTVDGVIKIVSTAPTNGKCRPDYETDKPVAGLRSWDTHIQTVSTASYAETEEEFGSAPLSNNEWFWLTNQCSAIYTNGSGAGICTCGYGD
jgi:hypothetical protein